MGSRESFVFGQAVDEARKRGLVNRGPLWPEEFQREDLETLFRFVTECCWTYNEANSGTERIPGPEYVRVACEEWLRCRELGRSLIIEKSRRLVMSWVLRACELWRCGLKAEKGVVCGLTYEKSAEHVWRIWWLYNELRNRRKDWNLDAHVGRGGSEGAQMFDQVILPNGSLIVSLNQAGQSFQGSGYSWVTMEEFSLYKNPEYMWAQARRVTEGKPGTVGGSVVAITNASSNKAWQKLKD
jgi:hypothetical protein